MDPVSRHTFDDVSCLFCVMCLITCSHNTGSIENKAFLLCDVYMCATTLCLELLTLDSVTVSFSIKTTPKSTKSGLTKQVFTQYNWSVTHILTVHMDKNRLARHAFHASNGGLCREVTLYNCTHIVSCRKCNWNRILIVRPHAGVIHDHRWHVMSSIICISCILKLTQDSGLH